MINIWAKREFTDGLVFRPMCITCCGMGSIPGLEIEIQHQVFAQRGRKKKKTNKATQINT